MQKNPIYLTLNKDELILDLELVYFVVLQYICNESPPNNFYAADLRSKDRYWYQINQGFFYEQPKVFFHQVWMKDIFSSLEQIIFGWKLRKKAQDIKKTNEHAFVTQNIYGFIQGPWPY